MDNIEHYLNAINDKLADISSSMSELSNTTFHLTRPSFVHQPKIYMDGNAWCALYGENLQEGCAGFGANPEAALLDFDRAWVGLNTQPQEAAQ